MLSAFYEPCDVLTPLLPIAAALRPVRTLEEVAGPGPGSTAANQAAAPGSAKKRKRALVFADQSERGVPLEQEILDAPRQLVAKLECEPKLLFCLHRLGGS